MVAFKKENEGNNKTEDWSRMTVDGLTSDFQLIRSCKPNYFIYFPI